MAQMCIKGCLASLEGKSGPYVADKSVYEHEKWKGVLTGQRFKIKIYRGYNMDSSIISIELY